jgi:sec-independent protein translocase protein TatC
MDSLVTHLIELRRRSLYVLSFFSALCLLFFFAAPHLFHQFIKPLLDVLPAEESLIATQLTTPLLTPLKLAVDAALLATTPFALLQLWYFVSPALYRKEREYFRWAIAGSLLLFLVGVLFCFYVVLPFMLQFFAHAIPAGVKWMPDITYTVDFITRMLLLFGLCFQVPLVCLLLVYLQWTTIETLKTIRPYVIVGAFIVGMLLTPPDVLSQIMLAVPLCLLYELGILLSALVLRRRRE